MSKQPQVTVEMSPAEARAWIKQHNGGTLTTEESALLFSLALRVEQELHRTDPN